MPARNVTRCRAKSSFDLDLLDEINCVYWIPMIPGTQFRSLAAMRAVWDRHGSQILPHYIRQRPGTRPFALWALGELPLPPLKHPPAEHALRTHIGDVVFYSAWHYFGSRTGPDGYYCAGSAWGEFQYLRELGVIDDAEAALAKEWVDDRHYETNPEYRDYDTLSKL